MAAPVGTTVTGPASTAGATDIEFTFRWPAGCSVAVAQESRRDSISASMRYRVTVHQGDENAPFLVRLSDFDVQEVNGQAPPAAVVTQLTGVFGAVPTFEVDDDGVYLGARDVEQMLDAMAVAGVIPRAAAEDLRNNDVLVEQLHVAAAETSWQAWVGLWALVGSSGGGEIGEHGASTRIERVGGVDGGRVSMRATQEPSGVALQERLTELMNGAAGEVEGSVSTAIEATFDPLTLRPDRATYEKNITLQVDGTSQSRFERREMLFEWDDATGCD